MLDLIPRRIPQLVRRVLHEKRHDVFAGGCDGGVDDGRNGAFEDRIRRRTSVLGVVVRPLDVVEGGCEVDRAAQVSVRWQTAAAYGGEVGELREREIGRASCRERV